MLLARPPVLAYSLAILSPRILGLPNCSATGYFCWHVLRMFPGNCTQGKHAAFHDREEEDMVGSEGLEPPTSCL
jgi:hypothetical protein